MDSPLITPTDLAAQLSGDAPPVLVDVRWQLGTGVEANRADYLKGHLPGAAFLDLESTLSDPVAEGGRGGRHPMPSLERVQEALRAVGVCSSRPVVFYDAKRSLGAARAWWVASYYGVEDAAVLDGGLAAWQAAGLPVETGEVEPDPGNVELQAGGRELVEAADVAAVGEGTQVIDARPADRYRGENETVDPVAGHIPGALSLPALSILDRDGRFPDRERLEELLGAAGGSGGAPSVVYCGSGVQAAHLALALEARALGPAAPAVYVGSWSDWITDPSRPIATGPNPR
ncbi:sulfurtransferase [Ornithinimicrobium panacihumi]|uniref:sulfurtransferase n=1 Tax=Ornithinimicrobium panacihumi TaxID=2008449 RepID=UPI003F8C8380